jgi:hypothetical protein
MDGIPLPIVHGLFNARAAHLHLSLAPGTNTKALRGGQLP